jgi:hypothetical protein
MYAESNLLLSALAASYGGGFGNPPTSGTVHGYDGSVLANGSNLVNGHGTTIQLRGFDIEGTVSASIRNANQGGVGDITGGTYNVDVANGPTLSYVQAWKPNVIRLGVNEASWMGYSVNENNGTVVNPDPYGVYRSQLIAKVAQYNSIGCYVILVLAWTNPGRSAPFGQDIMANQDNSIQCWQSLASVFGYPNGTALKMNGGTVDNRSVIFELFNEPEPYGDSAGNWNLLMNGGLYNSSYATVQSSGGGYQFVLPYFCTTPTGGTGSFVAGETFTTTSPTGITGKILCYYLNTTTGLASSGTQHIDVFSVTGGTIATGTVITGSTSGTSVTVTNGTYGWYVAGHAQMLSAIRATGAGNLCLLSGLNYNKDLGSWGAYAPTDTTAPTGWNAGTYGVWTANIGASWHPYPSASRITAVSVATGGSGYSGLTSTTTSVGTTTTLNDSSQSWTVNSKVGQIVIYTVSSVTYQATVTANTATQLTFAAQGAAPTSGISYSLGDMILLPMDESGGPSSGGVYWQAALQVTSTSAGVITGVQLAGWTAGTPGVSGGNENEYGGTTYSGALVGGVYSQLTEPTGPVGQYSTTGSGTGATFNLTFSTTGNSGTGDWPAYDTWAQVVTLKNTFNGGAGVPIVITETGEHTGAGIVGAPWLSALTAWCDTNGVSLSAFSYNPNGGWYNANGWDFGLIQANHTPQPGAGQFMFNWMSNHAT